MEHRHIDTDGSILTVAAIVSIMEHGKDSDLIALMRRLRREPFSQSADNAMTAAENVYVYGASILIKECLNLWRSEANDRKP